MGSGANTGQFLGQHLSFVLFWMSIWGTQLPASGRICPCLDLSPSPRRCCLTLDIGLPPSMALSGCFDSWEGHRAPQNFLCGVCSAPEPCVEWEAAAGLQHGLFPLLSRGNPQTSPAAPSLPHF